MYLCVGDQYRNLDNAVMSLRYKTLIHIAFYSTLLIHTGVLFAKLTGGAIFPTIQTALSFELSVDSVVEGRPSLYIRGFHKCTTLAIMAILPLYSNGIVLVNPKFDITGYESITFQD